MDPIPPSPLQNRAADLVAPLDQLRRGDASRVGTKGANLGALLELGIAVPPGFAVTAAALRQFLAQPALAGPLQQQLATIRDAQNPQGIEAASKALRRAVADAAVPPALYGAIEAAYEQLCDAEATPDLAVVVRASPIGDGMTAPAAVNVRGAAALVERIRQTWASLYSTTAILERERDGIPHDVPLGVVVQKMVASETSGFVHPQDPVMGDRARILVESAWGLGEGLVGGIVPPDRFVVDRDTLAVLSSHIVHKDVQVLPEPVAAAPRMAATRTHAVDPERADAPSLTPEEVSRLAEIAVAVEAQFGAPQQLEFTIEWLHGQRRIRIVQARAASLSSPMGRTPIPAQVAAVPTLDAAPLPTVPTTRSR